MRGSIRGAARNGNNLLLAQVPTFETIGESLSFYRDELDKMGVAFDASRVAVTRGLMVANNDNERAEAHVLRGKFLTEVQSLATDPKFQSKTFVPAERHKKPCPSDRSVGSGRCSGIIGRDDRAG